MILYELSNILFLSHSCYGWMLAKNCILHCTQSSTERQQHTKNFLAKISNEQISSADGILHRWVKTAKIRGNLQFENNHQNWVRFSAQFQNIKESVIYPDD